MRFILFILAFFTLTANAQFLPCYETTNCNFEYLQCAVYEVQDCDGNTIETATYGFDTNGLTNVQSSDFISWSGVITDEITVTPIDGYDCLQVCQTLFVFCDVAPLVQEMCQPLILDEDGDGIPDDEEIADGTDPTDPCDNRYDGAELCAVIAAGNTLLAGLDCDGGGVLNSWECDNGLDPTDGEDDDADGDGTLADTDDDDSDPCVTPTIILPTNDCDGDGTTADTDTDDNDPCIDPDLVACNALVAALDCDGGGVTDCEENTAGTDPTDPSDDVTCDNYMALGIDLCAYIAANPTYAIATADCDLGGVDNVTECTNGTDPTDIFDDVPEPAMDITKSTSYGVIDVDSDAGWMFETPFDYYVEVCNTGNEDLTNVTVTDAIPTTLDLNNVTTTGADNTAGSNVEVVFASLAVGDCETVTINVQPNIDHNGIQIDITNVANGVSDQTPQETATTILPAAPCNACVAVYYADNHTETTDNSNQNNWGNQGLTIIGDEIIRLAPSHPSHRFIYPNPSISWDNVVATVCGQRCELDVTLAPTGTNVAAGVVLMDNLVAELAGLIGATIPRGYSSYPVNGPFDLKYYLFQANCDCEGELSIEMTSETGNTNAKITFAKETFKACEEPEYSITDAELVCIEPTCTDFTTATDLCAYVTANPKSTLALADCDNGGIDNITECENGGDPNDPNDDNACVGTSPCDCGVDTGCTESLIVTGSSISMNLGVYPEAGLLPFQASIALGSVVGNSNCSGTESLIIDWGDGNTEPWSSSSVSHTYNSAGVYYITITGTDNCGKPISLIWGQVEIDATGNIASVDTGEMNLGLEGRASNVSVNTSNCPIFNLDFNPILFSASDGEYRVSVDGGITFSAYADAGNTITMPFNYGDNNVVVEFISDDFANDTGETYSIRFEGVYSVICQ